MGQLYVISYPDDTFIVSSVEYDNVQDAEAWQASVLLHNPTVGVLLPKVVWDNTLTGELFQLDSAKNAKLEELYSEGVSRLYSPVATLSVISDVRIYFKDNQELTPVGLSDREVITAYAAAAINISLLTDEQDVKDYDVVVNPMWPPAPVLISNSAAVCASQINAGVTTLLDTAVWAPLNCTLTTQGAVANFDVIGNTLEFTGYGTQDLKVTVQVTGSSSDGMEGRYRIGFAIDGVLPVLSMTLPVEDKDGYGHASYTTIVSMMEGEVLQPYIMNTTKDKEFVLDDIVITVERWTG